METAGGRVVSDAERRSQRAFEVGWCGSLIPRRAQTGLSQSELKMSDRDDVARALGGRSGQVFPQKDRVSLNGVFAGVVTCDAG